MQQTNLMSREDLKNFIHAAEHSQSLRIKLQGCTSTTRILEIAKEYGFSITLNDLVENNEAEKAEQWFINNKISPFKK